MKELIKPKALKKGDTIALISISGGRTGDKAIEVPSEGILHTGICAMGGRGYYLHFVDSSIAKREVLFGI